MGQDREHRIRKRAHELWDAEGRPDGRHERHWLAAEGEVDGLDPPHGAIERTTGMEPHSELDEDVDAEGASETAASDRGGRRPAQPRAERC